MRPPRSFICAQDLRQHHRRVGDGAAKRSGMEVALGPAQIELAIDEAAQPVADRRHAAVEHRRIGDHHDVGGELGLMGLDEVVEVGGPDFLLAFEDDLHVDRELPGLLQVRLDGLEVHEDLALVVGRAARVDLAVANGGFKRRRLPQLERVDRLHVVVAVEEDGRRALGAQPVAIDDRVAWCLDEADVVEADASHLLGGPLGTAADVAGMLRQRADARNGEVGLQLLDVAVAIGVDVVDDVVHWSQLSQSR